MNNLNFNSQLADRSTKLHDLAHEFHKCCKYHQTIESKKYYLLIIDQMIESFPFLSVLETYEDIKEAFYSLIDLQEEVRKPSYSCQGIEILHSDEYDRAQSKSYAEYYTWAYLDGLDPMYKHLDFNGTVLEAVRQYRTILDEFQQEMITSMITAQSYHSPKSYF